jgi:hypothetical protein
VVGSGGLGVEGWIESSEGSAATTVEQWYWGGHARQGRSGVRALVFSVQCLGSASGGFAGRWSVIVRANLVARLSRGLSPRVGVL